MSVYDQDSRYDPTLDPRWLGEADEEPEEIDRLALGQEIAELTFRQKLFQSEGWPYLRADLEKLIESCEKRIRNPNVCNTMEKVSEQRGAIRVLEELLRIPEQIQNELRDKNEQLEEATEAAP